MPEGDTVYRAARRLHEALAGREVTEFDMRVPQVATVDLRGEIAHEVVARGKHLLHHIGAYTLHSHLKMEGEWHVYRRGERWRKPAFKARAIVGNARFQCVGFELAMIDIVPTRDDDSLIGYLGPDPLRDDWDPAVAARRVGSDTRALHVALLDQRNVAGFGNVYANELCFVRGILPTTPANGTDAAAVVDLGARMLRANRDRRVRTFTGDARPGKERWVYGREGRPCRRCATLIRSDELGANVLSERVIYWCPLCQT